MADRQQHEAQPLRDYFDGSGGFYVEVGVKSPSAGSKTWPLELAGWSGALVEPQPEVAAFLVTARDAKVFAVACVAPDVAGEPLELRIASPLAAIDVGRRVSAVSTEYTVTVPTRTLDDILVEAEAPQPFDLLALDTNGRELDALLGFEFERWQPRLIVIADPAVDLQRHRFLNASGYRLIRRRGGCGWYVPAGSEAAARGDRWTVARDYYFMLPFRKTWQALRQFVRRIIATAD